MHHHPNPESAEGSFGGVLSDRSPDLGSAEDSFDGALLGLLIDEHAGLWSLSELSRSLASSGDAAGCGCDPASHEVEDAVARLYAAGLIHWIGEFVFAARAAHVAQRLAG